VDGPGSRRPVTTAEAARVRASARTLFLSDWRFTRISMNPRLAARSDSSVSGIYFA